MNSYLKSSSLFFILLNYNFLRAFHLFVCCCLMLLLLATAPIMAQVERCGTQQQWAKTPQQKAKQTDLSEQIKAWIVTHANSIESRSIVTIPVVVHVVWNQVEENINDEQVLAQLNILNEDFRARNRQLNDLPDEFRTVLADTQIEFCLTKEDHRGRATTGITRSYTLERSIANNHNIIKDATFGGVDAWDTKRFLNIWVGKREDRILGEATMPGEAEAALDGIVIDYRAFGKGGTTVGNEPYHLGRTLIHEVGHYLGLKHVWGVESDNTLCLYDDDINDTPIQRFTYSNECPNGLKSTCNSTDMYMNFMNYTDDDCMSMFTVNQSERMIAVLNTVRSGLLVQGKKCQFMTNLSPVLDLAQAVQIFPNPNCGELAIAFNTTKKEIVNIELYNALGQQLKTFQTTTQQAYTLSTSEFSNGIYYLHFLASNQHFVHTVSIQCP